MGIKPDPVARRLEYRKVLHDHSVLATGNSFSKSNGKPDSASLPYRTYASKDSFAQNSSYIEQDTLVVVVLRSGGRGLIVRMIESVMGKERSHPTVQIHELQTKPHCFL